MLTSKFIIVADPLLNEYGSCRPPILISKELVVEGYEVEVLTLSVDASIRKRLESHGITVHTLRNTIPSAPYSLFWFKSWLTESFIPLNSKRFQNTDGIVVNFSNIINISSDFWYAQGPPTLTLDNIKSCLRWYYKFAYCIGRPFLKIIDKMNTRMFFMKTKKVVCNSGYLQKIYGQLGVKVDSVIYPPLDCDLFKPQTSNPAADYVVTYYGKETNLHVLKRLADAGIKIKIFGSKMNPSRVLKKHPNIEVLGAVSDSELIKLYSNALLTVYPFLDEPFGYVPVESMACGTPVLTFNRQGPGETVINGITGWLVDKDEDFIKLAVKIWKHGYSSSMRKTCRKRALFFDRREIVKKWMELMKNSE